MLKSRIRPFAGILATLTLLGTGFAGMTLLRPMGFAGQALRFAGLTHFDKLSASRAGEPA